jgi:hypothetical protein
MQTSFNALKIETKREVPLPARGDEAVCFNQLSKIKQNSKQIQRKREISVLSQLEEYAGTEECQQQIDFAPVKRNWEGRNCFKWGYKGMIAD